MHYVYILQSLSTRRYYIGETKNISDRLKRHNGNRSKATKGRGPWMLVILCIVEDKSTAVRLERKLKSMKNTEKAISYLQRHCKKIEHSD